MALLCKNANKFINNNKQQDVGEWIMTVPMLYILKLEDHLEEQFKSILSGFVSPITYTNGYPKFIMNHFYQTLTMEYTICNHDKPEEVIITMSDVLIIAYGRFRYTKMKLKHKIEFLKPEINSGS